jgi:putative RNA 2'-phosphotransferase
MARSDTELSKAVSHALRHDPSSYGLALDSEGWVKVQDLVAALGNRHSDWENLDEERLQEMIDRSSKRRHEILNGKIRAIYGHSTPDRVVKQAAVPPALLYHGTDSDAAAKILSEGLKPMTRQYVHLSRPAHCPRTRASKRQSSGNSTSAGGRCEPQRRGLLRRKRVGLARRLHSSGFRIEGCIEVAQGLLGLPSEG